MSSKIKTTGLAFVAVAIMGMAGASAQAFEMHVTTSNSASIIGQQQEQFVLTTSAGTVVCTTATFEGTVTGQGQQITNQHSTLTPTLAGCSAFGQAAQVLMNGCKFTITNKSASGQTTAQTAYVDVTGCTTGKQIEAKTAICTMTVPEQHHISHVVFENTANTPHDLVANVTLTGITHEFHGPFCPGQGGITTVPLTNASTKGKATIVTREDKGTEQVTLHNHQFGKLIQSGTQVGILAT